MAIQKLLPLSPIHHPTGRGDRVAATLPRLRVVAEPRPARILDIDSECRPDAYLGSDYTTRSLTGIAAQFIGEPVMWCRVVTAKSRRSFAAQSRQMLTEFVALYNEADIVTGHNIRRHDLPIINASCIYYGLPPLGAKKTSDTLLDMPRAAQVFSRSQENLGDMFDVLADKYHMNNARWKRANLLEDPTVTRERVMSDVEMHIELRGKMLERGVLKAAPRWWRP